MRSVYKLFFSCLFVFIGFSLFFPVFAFAQIPNGLKSIIDKTPRVAFWHGNVNQYISPVTALWTSDPDGVSGIAEDFTGRESEYCKKIYPRSLGASYYRVDYINIWKGFNGIEKEEWKEVKVYRCIQPVENIIDIPVKQEYFSRGVQKVPKISVTNDMVNQHVDMSSGFWMTDPDGVSSNRVDLNKYCKKWYPQTDRAILTEKEESLYTWRGVGNNHGPYTRVEKTYYCLPKIGLEKKIVPRIAIVNNKIGKHIDMITGEWVNDPSGYTEQGIDKTEYCKIFYPETTMAAQDKKESIPFWVDNEGEVDNSQQVITTYKCISTQTVKKSVRVLSPNGSETFSPGQKFDITWETIGIPEGTQTIIGLSDLRIKHTPIKKLNLTGHVVNKLNVISRDGDTIVYKQSFTVPNYSGLDIPKSYKPFFGDANYLIQIEVANTIDSPFAVPFIFDFSDSPFTVTGAIPEGKPKTVLKKRR